MITTITIMKKGLTVNVHQSARGGKKSGMVWAFKGLLVACLLISFGACQSTEAPLVEGAYTTGVFTINEGVFGNSSGTITHYDRSSGNATSSIFQAANKRELGDVVQSMHLHNGQAYLVVNNSNKIEVVDAETFQEKAQITGLRLPRYCLAVSATEAYVSEWGTDGLTGTLARIDLEQNTIIERIPVGKGPEQLLKANDQLYISHPGGFGDNNEVSVLDLNTRQVTTIRVGDRPSGLVLDGMGRVWVACAGKVVYTTYPNIDVSASTESSLTLLDPSTQQVARTYSFGKGNPVGNLTLNTTDGRTLYYTREGQVWAFDAVAETENRLFAGRYYGLGYDPVSQHLYAATSSGVNEATVEIRTINDGREVDTYTAGNFANGFVFLP